MIRMARSTAVAFAALAALGALAGCSARGSRGDDRIAEDPVCLYNRDLGCMEVRVDERTPRAVHLGRTYYFCAESCRIAFERDPGKYAPAE